jgi:hypothetical protein
LQNMRPLPIGRWLLMQVMRQLPPIEMSRMQSWML